MTTSWAEIWETALSRHDEAELRAHFPQVAPDAALRGLGDDRYLAAMAQRVFAAGFRWKVIVAKWEGFEAAFRGFDPAWVAGLDGADIEALCADTRIVRNRPKVVSTIENAAFVKKIAQEHGSFGAWLAAWPAEDTLGLWAALKEGGSRLGGDTGPFFLRLVGRDTFRFSPSVVDALVHWGAIPRKPGGKRIEQQAQDAILGWCAESGLSQGAVSTVLARSFGEVYGWR